MPYVRYTVTESNGFFFIKYQYPSRWDRVWIKQFFDINGNILICLQTDQSEVPS